jgi:hypothetical protein
MTMEVIEEVWATISDVPGYSVSNHGDVMNNKTETLIKPQLTPQGIVYVPLYADSKTITRSVKVLVAKAFVAGETDIFGTPINLDGDKTNNRVDNIVWRPLWFAVKYSRQFLHPYIHAEVGPVYDIATQDRYETVYEVAVTNGLLFREVYRSCFSSTRVFPTGQTFHIPDTIQVR